MMAKLVEVGGIGMYERTRARASGSVCTARCGKNRASILVVQLVGIVVKIADAKDPAGSASKPCLHP